MRVLTVWPSNIVWSGSILSLIHIFILNAGKNINIERGATFGSDLSLGDNSGVGINCEILGPCVIGNDVMMGPEAVSYTHLDVYKRQPQGITGAWQCGPRNLATFENGLRQKIELVYARGANVKTDIDVFFETFKVMLVRRTGK